MAFKKGENPYTRVKSELDRVIDEITSRKTFNLGSYEISNTNANLIELKGLVQAANALGYTVTLRMDGPKTIRIEAVEVKAIRSESHFYFSAFKV